MAGDAKLFHDPMVKHAHAAGRDRAHRQLLVSGDAQLAHDKNVEGSAERAGDFICDGYAATRHCQHEQIPPIGVSRELCGELPAGLATIAKEPRRYKVRLYGHVSKSSNAESRPRHFSKLAKRIDNL
jgi:hypothetical protein